MGKSSGTRGTRGKQKSLLDPKSSSGTKSSLTMLSTHASGKENEKENVNVSSF